MENLTKPDDVRVADDILARFTEPYGNEAYIRAANLLTFIRGIVWRNGICTEAGARRTWRELENRQFDMELMVEMVNEYVYRVGFTRLKSEVCDRQAEAMSWVTRSHGMPAEMAKLASAEIDIKNGLAKSPFLMFLFSLGMGDYQRRLAEVGVERMMAGPPPARQRQQPAPAPTVALPGAKG